MIIISTRCTRQMRHFSSFRHEGTEGWTYRCPSVATFGSFGPCPRRLVRPIFPNIAKKSRPVARATGNVTPAPAREGQTLLCAIAPLRELSLLHAMQHRGPQKNNPLKRCKRLHSVASPLSIVNCPLSIVGITFVPSARIETCPGGQVKETILEAHR